MPPVVEKGGQFQADFAHDLRPHVQRLAGVPPRLIRQLRPALGSVPMLGLDCILHMLLHLVVSLPHCFFPRGLHTLRLAA